MKINRLFLILAVSFLLGQSMALPGNIDVELTEIAFQGQTVFTSEKLIQTAGWQEPQSYTDNLVERGIEKILRLYEDSGYPYCQVLVDNLKLSHDKKVNLTLKIIEGPLVRVSQVQFEGVSTGISKALHKEIDFHPDEKYSAQRWEERIRHLKNLPYLREVSDPELKTGPRFDQAVISLKVEEINNSLSGAVGYVPPQSTRAGFLTGQISLEFSNFLGGARQVGILWNKKDQKSYNLEFAFTEYWLGGTPFSAKLEFKQSQADSSYSQVQIEQQTTYRLNRRLRVSSLLSWERIYQKSYLKNSFPSSRKLGLGLKLEWNTLDYRLNPSRGSDLEAQITFIRWQKTDTLTISKTAQKDKLRDIQLTLWKFIPTWQNQTVGVKMAFTQISSSGTLLSPADLYKLGGINTLRGYYSQQFWADKVFLTTLEYRFLLSGQARFYLFTDMARFRRNYLQAGELITKRSFKSGYGLGLWLNSRVGLVNLDLGLGQSDQLGDLKVHIGLRNRF